MNIQTMDSTNIKEDKQSYQLCTVERLLCECKKVYKNEFTLRRHQATVCPLRGKPFDSRILDVVIVAVRLHYMLPFSGKKRAAAEMLQEANKSKSFNFALNRPADFQILTNVRRVFADDHEASDMDNASQSPAKKIHLESYTGERSTLLESKVSGRTNETISINADNIPSIKSTGDNVIHECWR